MKKSLGIATIIFLVVVGNFIIDLHSARALPSLLRFWEIYDSVNVDDENDDRPNLRIFGPDPNHNYVYPEFLPYELDPDIKDWCVLGPGDDCARYNGPGNSVPRPTASTLELRPRDKIMELVPDGYGLTGINYSSDDTGCYIGIQSAPVNNQGVVDFNQIHASAYVCVIENDYEIKGAPFDSSIVDMLGLRRLVNIVDRYYDTEYYTPEMTRAGYSTLIDGINPEAKKIKYREYSTLSGNDKPDPQIPYRPLEAQGYILTGWSWGAGTSGIGGSPYECYYQEYAPLNNNNPGTVYKFGDINTGNCSASDRLPGFSSLRIGLAS